MRLRFGHQHSQIWPILARFVDYYLLFWGPEAISIVIEAQGALTCRSSTLTDLANSGHFVVYYSLFWGPGEVSTINEPLGAFTIW